MFLESPTFRELKHCLYFFQLFGLQNFSLGSLQSKSYDYSKILFPFYSLLVTVVVGCENVFFFFYEKNQVADNNIKHDTINRVLSTGLGVSTFILITLVQIFTFITRNGQKQVFLNVQNISENFSALLKHQLKYREFKIRYIWKLFFVVIYVITTHALLGFIEKTLLLTISITIIVTVGVQFSFFGDLINWHLKKLMQVLEESIELWGSDVFLVQTNDSNFTNLKFQKTLKAIKRIHLKIWETSEMINDSYGKQILIFVMVNVFGLTYGGYKSATSLVERSSNEFLGVFVVVSLLNVSSLALIVHSANKSQITVTLMQFDYDFEQFLCNFRLKISRKFYMA